MMTPTRSSYSHYPQMGAGYAPYVAQNPPYAVNSGAIGRSSMNVVVPVPGTHFVHQGPPDQSDIPLRRRRASKPKVKTGCITCKIRHVKCDEAKPACKRCTSTGRKCDGYDTPNQNTDSTSVVRRSLPPVQQSTSMSLAFQGTVQEREIFQRFQDLTIPALNGGSESEFWQSLVLRVGIQEPVIRQAIIALGTIHEDWRIRGGRQTGDLISRPNHQRALYLYGKALRQLNERLANQQGDSAKLAIIASILFTCFEVLRRNDMTAIVHYRAGMRELMRQMNLRPSNLDSDSDAQVALKQIPQDELDILLRVFARYDVQACTFAKPRAERLAADISTLPPSKLTLKDVRHHLDNLIIAAYQLISFDGTLYRYWPPENVPVEWLTHINQQLGMFEKWQAALETFFNTSEVRLPPSDAKSLLGLRLQIKVALIRLRTSWNCGPETTYDAYRGDFESMVASVERVTQALALTDADPLEKENTPFTMDLGIIHPLFYIAHKCRDHRLRKRAIAQLRKAGKEGVWDGPVMACLAKRMMQIEENGLISGQTVPERNRIHRVQKEVDYEGRRIMTEMTLAQDDSWVKWESIREAIPF